MGDGEESPPEENATVEVHPDGSATILTGTSPHGQGHATAWAMLASDKLGIPVDRITLKWGDTDLVPEGGGTGGSRSLQQGGLAVQQASVELIELARGRAAAALEASEADLVFDAGRSAFAVAGDPEASVPLARLARRERLLVRTVFSAPGATFPFGTHVAVAEVDTETGKVTLRQMVTVDDAGFVLNPLLAEGQRHGGIAQGAAQAFLEEFVYDADGNPLTASLADYPFLSATEVPSFDLADMATPTSYNPMGARASARRARSARRPPCRTRSWTPLPTWACGTSTCPRHRSGSGEHCGRPARQGAPRGRPPGPARKVHDAGRAQGKQRAAV